MRKQIFLTPNDEWIFLDDIVVKKDEVVSVEIDAISEPEYTNGTPLPAIAIGIRNFDCEVVKAFETFEERDKIAVAILNELGIEADYVDGAEEE